jgi:adenine-specific DNA-methyltransferase
MVEKIQPGTPGGTEENIEKVAELFPEVVTEVEDAEGNLEHVVDFDALRDLLGDVAEGQRERYQFTWPGKAAAKVEARKPIRKTMRPERDRSVDWETTRNLYIEGDNLDALKLLKETYAGQVKMIYIDPPYNTGNDFVYDDDFAQTHEEYDSESGDYDEDGGRLVANPNSNGRFHSDWCSMIYPRLVLARDLLSADGVIFISIDDNESANIRKICDEVFGASNFVALAPRKTGAGSAASRSASVLRKMNDFILIYAKSSDTAFRLIVKGEKQYPYSDEYGDYRLAQFNASGSDATRRARPNMFYPIYLDITGTLTTKKPANYTQVIFPPKVNGEDGRWLWRPEKFETDKSKYITFTNNHIQRKIYYDPSVDQKEYQVDRAWYDEYTNAAGTKEVDTLFGIKRIFDHPKPVDLIKRLIHLVDSDDFLVLDFFSGSGTTADAVMRVNVADSGSRHFILVQLPELFEADSIAGRAGYKTICDIGEERIRRAGKKIAAEVEEANRQLKLGEEPKPVPDIGFRVLRIDSSNMEDTYRTPGETGQMDLLSLADNVKLDRTPEDLLFEVLPKFRIPYSARIERRELGGRECFLVDGNRLVACFDTEVGTETIEEMAKLEPDYAVMRDASMRDDATQANFEELFKTYSPDTVRRVI